MAAESDSESGAGEPGPITISVQMDALAQLALQELTAEGMSIDEAVRTAIIDVGARLAAKRRTDHRDDRAVVSGAEAFDAWVDQQVADAPPPSDCQVRVLGPAFLEGRRPNACGALYQPEGWTGPDHRDLTECHLPDCLVDGYWESPTATNEFRDR